jgi:hypothetical protein
LLSDGGEDTGEPGHRVFEQCGLANGGRLTHVSEPVGGATFYRTKPEIQKLAFAAAGATALFGQTLPPPVDFGGIVTGGAWRLADFPPGAVRDA